MVHTAQDAESDANASELQDRLVPEIKCRQGWKMFVRSPHEKPFPEDLVMWERADDITVGIGSHVVALRLDEARKLARLLNDLVLRVEKRNRKQA